MIKLSKLFSDFKKLLSSIFSFNKKVLILGISLSLLLCLFSSQPAKAFLDQIPIIGGFVSGVTDTLEGMVELIGWVVSMPIRIPFFFLVLVIALFGFIAAIIFGIVASMLSMMIEASLSVRVVSGWVVDVGFDFTKNFANMLIILILAFIGLATILKFKEYEAKKILPKLILVALLINFTPVMVGAIVDIGSLFANFFFIEVKNSGAISDLANFNDFINETISDLGTVITINGYFLANLLGGDDPIIGTFLSIIMKHLVMIAFYTIATLVYLLVFILFFARFIILWVLVILAPIAFFSQILPESVTVKALFPSILHWNKWWETLIQWAFIGVPLGFFLYLSSWIITHSKGMPLSTDALVNNVAIGPLTIPFGTIIQQTIGPMVAIFMLIVGVIVSVESMPGVAKQIIDRAKGAGKGIAKSRITRRVTGTAAGWAGRRLAGEIPGREAFGKATRWGAGKTRGGAAWTGRRWGIRRVAGWAGRRKKEIVESKPYKSVVGSRPYKITKEAAKKGTEIYKKSITEPIQRTRKAAVGGLLKYEAESKAARIEIPKEFKEMAREDKERFIETKSDRAERLALAGEMGGDLAQAKPEFKEKIMEDAQRMAKDKTYGKHVKKIMENVPDMMTESIAVDLKGTKEEKDKLKKKIDDKVAEIQASLTPAEIEKEVRVKYKLKETEAITDNHKTGFDAGLRDTAAAAISISVAKPSSIEKISNPKSLAVRTGSHGWSPKAWQKFTEKFGSDAINDLMDEPGGINSIVKDKPSFESFCRKNSRSARFLLFNRAGQQLGWKGEKFAKETGMNDKHKFEEMVRGMSPEEEEEIVRAAERIVEGGGESAGASESEEE